MGRVRDAGVWVGHVGVDVGGAGAGGGDGGGVVGGRVGWREGWVGVWGEESEGGGGWGVKVRGWWARC